MTDSSPTPDVEDFDRLLEQSSFGAEGARLLLDRATTSPRGNSASPTPISVLPATLASQFTLLALLPAGGEADMLRVADKNGIPFVLKLYRAGITPDSETWDALQKVDSPFVARIIEAGETDGRAYEVMEYVHGGTLLVWTKEERVPTYIITEIVRQITEGLKALHNQQVIHRDLKPANILVRSRYPLQLTLADFGLSRYLPEDVVFSRAGHTLTYTAPETFAGHVSPSRDWWSLGIIVHELATGEPPFRGLPDEHVMLDLTTRPFDSTNVLDGRLRELCMGLLVRDPNLRWGAVEVDQWLAGGSPPVPNGSSHDGLLPDRDPVVDHLRPTIQYERRTGRRNVIRKVLTTLKVITCEVLTTLKVVTRKALTTLNAGGDKVLTTLGVGSMAFLLANMLVEQIIWSVFLSAFIGGVSLLVQFLVEFDKRLQAVEGSLNRHFDTVEDLIRYRFTTINEATELFGRIENSAIRTDLVKQLVHHSANLDRSSHALIPLFAHSEITRVSDLMKGLSERGEITYEGEDHDWLLALTRNAQSSIDATSFIAIEASGPGFDGVCQRYLQAQQKAVDRKVRIRRIFMLDDPDGARDPELLRICKIQRDLGILVRILDPLTLPGLHQNWMFDFIVFDSVISFESTSAAWTKKGTKPAIASTRLVLSPQRVAERAEGFGELWAAARELDVYGSRRLLRPDSRAAG